ncbi:hypothetical protein NXY38_06775 [Bacteroides thetaiotaomicron]|uniref:hypothetical protein n=1 Tax=Bacteroides thetaiotaomicron TaxID=818 RepID=UPI002204BEC6|nr:hypothetical protein [Bacteroides thetaiotaomicron]UVV86267.1 hypothetical protein NXY38_06775 [Bacteroides thetaiotaomicron]
MKKWKLFFTMAISAFLIGMSVCSCQMNDDDGYYQEAAVDVTPADLFIASEAYQNLEKEIRKDIRRRQKCNRKVIPGRKRDVSTTHGAIVKSGNSYGCAGATK